MAGAITPKLVAQGAVQIPDSGYVTIFIDSADGVPKYKDSSGIVHAFSAITVSDGVHTDTDDTLIFNSSNFYITQDSNGNPVVNSSATVSASISSVTFKDGVHSFADDTLNFNGHQFYLTKDSSGNPSVNIDISTIDHGTLSGLLDDDHPQYLLINGTRAMAGTLNMADNDVVNSKKIEAEGFYIGSFHGANLYTDGGGFTHLDSAAPTIINQSGADVVIGNPGIEGTLINISGQNQQSSLKVSQIGQIGDNPALQDIASLHLHRHSTTLAPGIISTRAKSDTPVHADVVNGDELFKLYTAGRVGSAYEVAARMDVVVEGDPSAGILPGKIVFRTSPGVIDYGVQPPEAMTIHHDQHINMTNTLNVKNAVTSAGFYLRNSGEILPLSFNNNDFYLTKNSKGNPEVNLRKDNTWALHGHFVDIPPETVILEEYVPIQQTLLSFIGRTSKGSLGVVLRVNDTHQVNWAPKPRSGAFHKVYFYPNQLTYSAISSNIAQVGSRMQMDFYSISNDVKNFSWTLMGTEQF